MVVYTSGFFRTIKRVVKANNGTKITSSTKDNSKMI